MLAKMTSKGRLTIPKAVRNRLNLQPGDKISFIFDENNRCRLIPIKHSIKELKGMLGPTLKVVTDKEMEDAIQTMI